MDWEKLFSHLINFVRKKTPLVIVTKQFSENPWDSELFQIIPKYSTNKKYKAVNLIEQLEGRGLLIHDEERFTDYQEVFIDLASYIELFHSRNGLSRERMEMSAASEFDERVTSLVTPYLEKGQLKLKLRGRISWGHFRFVL